MKLVIIRHGEPDYVHDTLTEKGWREAGYLAERIAPMEVKAYYVSPLGRAQDTARPTLEKAGRTAVTCDWLREFTGKVRKPNLPDQDSIAWDWLPEDWTAEDWTADERFFSDRLWAGNEVMQAGGVKEAYDAVIRPFDALLSLYWKGSGSATRARPAEDFGPRPGVRYCPPRRSCATIGPSRRTGPAQIAPSRRTPLRE